MLFIICGIKNPKTGCGWYLVYLVRHYNLQKIRFILRNPHVDAQCLEKSYILYIHTKQQININVNIVLKRPERKCFLSQSFYFFETHTSEHSNSCFCCCCVKLHFSDQFCQGFFWPILSSGNLSLFSFPYNNLLGIG